jgi:hypothetical protein
LAIKTQLSQLAQCLGCQSWDILATTGKHAGGGFKEGELVIAEDGGASSDLYPAKIVKIVTRAEMVFQYFVHYQGWHKKYDTWIQGDQMVKLNDVEGREKLRRQALDKYKIARAADKAKRREAWFASRNRRDPKKKGGHSDDEINGDEFDSDSDDSDFDRFIPQGRNVGSKRKAAEDEESDEDEEERAIVEAALRAQTAVSEPTDGTRAAVDGGGDGADGPSGANSAGAVGGSAPSSVVNSIPSKHLAELLNEGKVGSAGWALVRRS